LSSINDNLPPYNPTTHPTTLTLYYLSLLLLFITFLDKKERKKKRKNEGCRVVG